jgi:hypothetical protein
MLHTGRHLHMSPTLGRYFLIMGAEISYTFYFYLSCGFPEIRFILLSVKASGLFKNFIFLP